MYDDEKLRGSTSSREYLESPAKAQMKELRNRLKQEGVQSAAATPGSDNLQGLKLQMLKQKMDDRKDAAQRGEDAKTEQQGTSIGTKTREQEIRKQRRTADEKPSADQLVRQGTAQAKAQEEMQKEEVATEEG